MPVGKAGQRAKGNQKALSSTAGGNREPALLLVLRRKGLVSPVAYNLG